MLIYSHSEKGFTLIELLILLFIISLLINMTTGNFGGILTNIRLKVAVRQLISDLRTTRHLAITRHSNYVIELIAIKNEYVIYQQEHKNHYLIKRHLSNEITAKHSRSGAKTIFHPLGTAQPNGTFTLTSSMGRAYGVVISSTGRIRVQE